MDRYGATDTRQALKRHCVSEQLRTGTLGGETVVECVNVYVYRGDAENSFDSLQSGGMVA